ncbi:MAG: type I restriction enzyme HsdR N-terminal domain-containing protein [Proteiniphilum sp.]|nr:type I restriction enzyme HsdR N-terminal domain-containing protein [Proteiniphilum sp.]MDD3909283.1 type I restriction enzyme HsdR N-terminal domain-containing protein [Proteiniphilum sp.]MDD4415213.1 type I restriction enzyme HsdR N-terminal domain-containing protein [Proteiniphilum sp.]
MYELNLPSFDAKIRKSNNGNQIFDPLRRKYVALTPEEWVRQHFVNYLITEKNYPASLIANETEIKLNSLTLRCDTVIYNNNLKPMMIVEYKEPETTITQVVFDQAARYSSVLRVPYIVVSNGMRHYCCLIDYENRTYRYLLEIPGYKDLISYNI